MKLNQLLISILLGFSSLLCAADEVVVTPARYSQSINDVIPSVIVIDRETIKRTPAADVADLLRWHAGLEIGRNGGPGQAASVFTRGTNSNHSSVLINGVKMNSATTGAPALEMINTSVIERIEVIKGPRSTVYGSEAIGGVINIITRTDEAENHASMHLSHGRYSTTEQGVDVKMANDYVSGDFSFNRFDSDGFPATATSNTKHGHDNDAIDINVNTKFGKSDWKLSYWRSEGTTAYDGFGINLDQDRKNDVINASIALPVTQNWLSNLSISKIRDEIRQNQLNFLSEKDFAYTDRLVYDWKNDISISGSILTFGISKSQEDTKSLSFGTRYKEKTDNHSAYAHQNINVGKHRFFGSTRYVDHDDFGDVTLWNAEYGFEITSNATFFTSFGTGFRAPDSNARFGFGGNPDLKEETSRSIELGVNLNFARSTSVSVRAFENKIENLIETILTDPTLFIFENRNVSIARIQGFEIGFKHKSKNWNINIEGIAQNPRNETEDSPLLRRAKRSLTSSLVYNHDKYFIQLNGLLNSERRDFGDVVLPGYGLFNLSTGIHFPNATFSIKVDNLLDKKYELASGFNTPGQSVFAELRLNFTE